MRDHLKFGHVVQENALKNKVYGQQMLNDQVITGTHFSANTYRKGDNPKRYYY